MRHQKFLFNSRENKGSIWIWYSSSIIVNALHQVCLRNIYDLSAVNCISLLYMLIQHCAVVRVSSHQHPHKITAPTTSTAPEQTPLIYKLKTQQIRTLQPQSNLLKKSLVSHKSHQHSHTVIFGWNFQKYPVTTVYAIVD